MLFMYTIIFVSIIKTCKISEPGIDIKVDIKPTKFAVNAQPCY